MTTFQKFAAAAGVAMIITALALPGRSTQETAVLKGLTGLSQGSIHAVEGQ